MPEAGPLTWGPYTLMPGVSITLGAPMTVTPGGDGSCTAADGDANRYVFAAGGEAGGGGGWYATTLEGTVAVTGPARFPSGTTVRFELSPVAAAQREEAARQAQEAIAARQEAWRQRTELAGQRLLEWLSDEQRKTYEEYRWFSLTASDGSPWRIIADGSYSGNVLQLDANGQPVCSYCAHPRSCPPSETYLAQALAIVSDVARFKTVANLYYRYRPSAGLTLSTENAASFSAGGTGGAGSATWTGLLQALRR